MLIFVVFEGFYEYNILIISKLILWIQTTNSGLFLMQ